MNFNPEKTKPHEQPKHTNPFEGLSVAELQEKSRIAEQERLIAEQERLELIERLGKIEKEMEEIQDKTGKRDVAKGIEAAHLVRRIKALATDVRDKDTILGELGDMATIILKREAEKK